MTADRSLQPTLVISSDVNELVVSWDNTTMDLSDPEHLGRLKPETRSTHAASQPAAIRVLADHFTDELPPVMSARTRSGGARDSKIGNRKGDGGHPAFSCISCGDK